MKQQLIDLAKLFSFLGFSNEVAGTMADSFLTPAEGVDPNLDINGILTQSQEYAKPHIKPALEAELRVQHKGKYYNDAMQKIIAASGGKLNRADFEHKGGDDDNVQRAIDAFKGLQGSTKQDDSDLAVKYNALLAEHNEFKQNAEQEKEAIRNEYSQKETKRELYDYTLSALSAAAAAKDGKPAKKISVELPHAAKVLMRDLEDNAIVKFVEKDGKRTPVLYSKESPDVQYTIGATPVSYDDFLSTGLKTNNWIQESNGSLKIDNTFTPPDRNSPDLSNDNKSPLRRQIETVTNKD